ncbi:hypothetical protein HKD37_06G016489 [Glycine soja]
MGINSISSFAKEDKNSSWEKPFHGVVKLKNLFGVGLIIRCSQGNFITAKTIIATGKPEPRIAKAWALLQGIKWITELDYQSFFLEVDCKVSDYLIAKQNGILESYHSVSSCKSLHNFYQNSRVSLVWRQANQVAHSLSRASRYYAYYSKKIFCCC